MVPARLVTGARHVRRCVVRLLPAFLLLSGGVDGKAAAQERAIRQPSSSDDPSVMTVSSQLRDIRTTGAAPLHGPMWDRLRAVRAAFGSGDDDVRTALPVARRDLPKRAFGRDVVMSVRAARP